MPGDGLDRAQRVSGVGGSYPALRALASGACCLGQCPVGLVIPIGGCFARSTGVEGVWECHTRHTPFPFVSGKFPFSSGCWPRTRVKTSECETENCLGRGCRKRGRCSQVRREAGVRRSNFPHHIGHRGVTGVTPAHIDSLPRELPSRIPTVTPPASRGIPGGRRTSLTEWHLKPGWDAPDSPRTETHL